jgi:hypothetical protein
METILGVIAVAVLYMLFKPGPIRTHREVRANSSTERSRPALPSGPTFHWSDGGNFDFEVVGESHYQENLRNLAGKHDEFGASTPYPAFLVPDDDNPYDNKAVAVFINSLKVGHLSREDARSFRRRLSSKKLTGQVTSCDALVRGGGLKDGKRLSFGVWLDMKEFV